MYYSPRQTEATIPPIRSKNMCSIKKATKLASSSLLQETEAESYTFNPIGQGQELHIGVAHMSHHQLFRLAYGINLIQLH